MSKRNHTDAGQALFSFAAPIVTPRGDGSFVVSPGKPLTRLTVKQAALRAGVSVWTLYRLIDQGYIAADRPSPGRILVHGNSLEQHMDRSRDPEFWSHPK